MSSSSAGYCTLCGAPFEAGHAFCARCGAALAGVSPGARMQRHVQLFAILLLVWGIVSLAFSLLAIAAASTVAVFLGKLIGSSAPQSTGLAALVVGIGALFSLTAALAIATGVGLLQYRPWARALGLVVSVLALLRPPMGTLLGIYGLWVLLSREGEGYYRLEAARRAPDVRAKF